jgi:type IV secretory pathway VirB2 component (pilin)
VKRGLSGKTRRGGPPLERQRIALRVIQLTFLVLAVWMFWFAASKYVELSNHTPGTFEPVPPTLTEIVAFLVAGVIATIAAVVMGLRVVRGPRLPPV